MPSILHSPCFDYSPDVGESCCLQAERFDCLSYLRYEVAHRPTSDTQNTHESTQRGTRELDYVGSLILGTPDLRSDLRVEGDKDKDSSEYGGGRRGWSFATIGTTLEPWNDSSLHCYLSPWGVHFNPIVCIWPMDPMLCPSILTIVQDVPS